MVLIYVKHLSTKPHRPIEASHIKGRGPKILIATEQNVTFLSESIITAPSTVSKRQGVKVASHGARRFSIL
jgi:hypothetical protein